MTTQSTTKPQSAIDMGLLTREEAAAYIGMGEDKFKTISGQINGVRLGAFKYYFKEALQDFIRSKIANTQN